MFSFQAVGESLRDIGRGPVFLPCSVTTNIFSAWAGGNQQQMRPLTNSSGHGGCSEETSQYSPLGEHGSAWIWQELVLSDTAQIKGMENVSDGLCFFP